MMDMFWYPFERVAAARRSGCGFRPAASSSIRPGVTGAAGRGAGRRGRALLRRASAAPTTCSRQPAAWRLHRRARAICGRPGRSPTNAAACFDPCAETRAEQAGCRRRATAARRRHLAHLGLLDRADGAGPLRPARRRGDRHPRAARGAWSRTTRCRTSSSQAASRACRRCWRRGIRVTVGTDGAISGNDLDMWMALRLAATIHRATPGVPT